MSSFDDYLNNTNAPATGTPRAGVYSANDKAIAEAAFNAGRAELEAENQRLREALQEVVSMDTRAMYGRCPDCYTDECNTDRVCKDMPLSKIGKAAKQALEGRDEIT